MFIVLIIKRQGVLNIGGQLKSLSCSKGTISTWTFLSFLYILAWTEKLCCCGNNSSYLISSLDRWRVGSQVHDDMGHPFHLIRYSISYEKTNKRSNGRLKTSLGTAPLKQALSTYFAALPLRKQSFAFLAFLTFIVLTRCCFFPKSSLVGLFNQSIHVW